MNDTSQHSEVELRTPEEFLAGKVFVHKEKQQVKKTVDLDRLLNPPHKKKASNIDNKCTFQPMLSKNSLDIAAKMGDAKSRLYGKSKGSATRKKTDLEPDYCFQPQINDRSKFLDKKSSMNKISRFQRLEIMVRF